MTEGADLIPLADSDNKGAVQLMFDLERTGAIAFRSTRLDIGGGEELTQDNWQSIGVFLGTVDRASRWWIGDWLIYGEAVFGEEAFQAIEPTTSERYDMAERVTGLDHQTLLNIRSICGKVLPGVRRPELGFWIHAEVAALEPDDQAHWLQRAVEEGWTKRDLRAAIQEANTGPLSTPPTPPTPGGEPGLSRSERLEAAARVVFNTAQTTSTGDRLVPSESWVQLAEALGEGS